MKLQIIKNENDIKELISGLSYGQNYILNPSENLCENIEERIFIINKSCNSEPLRLEKITDEVFLEFEGYSVEDNIWSIISSVENNQIPVLSDDSYSIKTFAQKAFNNKEVVFFNLDPSLYAYAKKLNFGNKISFSCINNRPCFNGLEKQPSVYKKIEHAYHAGEETIDFDPKTVSIATLRCYASTLSNLSGKKIRCSMKDGLITIFFKEEDRLSQLKRKFGYLLSEFEEDSDAIDFLKLLISDMESKSKDDHVEDKEFNKSDWDDDSSDF